MLVYEYMHNGTLRDQIHIHSQQEKQLEWISRLQIAEDAAKGCNIVSLLTKSHSKQRLHFDYNIFSFLQDSSTSTLAAILLSFTAM